MPDQFEVANYYRSIINDKVKRHRFFNFSTTQFCGASAVCFLLIEGFRKTSKKRQAKFIIDVYLQDPPTDKTAIKLHKDLSLFCEVINSSRSSLDRVKNQGSAEIKSVGKTWIDKLKNKKNISGLISSVATTRDSTRLSPNIFDDAQNLAINQIQDLLQHFNPNYDIQRSSKESYDIQIPALKRILHDLKFDCEDLGIF